MAGVTTTRIVLEGHSLGATASVWAASSPKFPLSKVGQEREGEDSHSCSPAPPMTQFTSHSEGIRSVRTDEEQEAAFLWWRIKFTSTTRSLPQG